MFSWYLFVHELQRIFNHRILEGDRTLLLLLSEKEDLCQDGCCGDHGHTDQHGDNLQLFTGTANFIYFVVKGLLNHLLEISEKLTLEYENIIQFT